ncbi:RICIN domain-containing protein [Nocardia sp. NPDC050175]|uniref:RICIN domain-containing protein n=1 Tax=Nocardia sp. NPDC050175 TaxID=3364317 RepID=UPI0037911982
MFELERSIRNPIHPHRSVEYALCGQPTGRSRAEDCLRADRAVNHRPGQRLREESIMGSTRTKLVLLAAVAVASSFILPQSANAAAGKTIKNAEGNCLAARSNGNEVFSLKCNGSKQQQWTISDSDKSIRNVGNKGCLATKSGGVYAYGCKDVDATRQWTISGKSIKNEGDGWCLTGEDASVGSFECDGSKEQQWTISD